MNININGHYEYVHSIVAAVVESIDVYTTFTQKQNITVDRNVNRKKCIRTDDCSTRKAAWQVQRKNRQRLQHFTKHYVTKQYA